ncbi:MAG: hypothetical protein M3N49_13975 [Candidatus Eremiobacteraeota bacterium]|nr:hypothetical protein [Candidatus Eremiobacteraeota bacterium]
MSGLRGTFAGVLATLVTFVAGDVALLYVMWGVGLGMKDIEWVPIFPLCIVVVVAGAAAIGMRLWRDHRIAITWTAALCIVLTVPVFGAALFLGAWGCSDGGGCHGPLTW